MQQAGLVDRKSAGGRAFAVNLASKGAKALRDGRVMLLDERARSLGRLTRKECKTMQEIIDKVLLNEDNEKWAGGTRHRLLESGPLFWHNSPHRLSGQHRRSAPAFLPNVRKHDGHFDCASGDEASR